MQGRVRQFTAARDRNLTQTYTNASQNAVVGNTPSNKPSFNEPSTSAFLKQTKSELCFKCVNGKLIKKKEEKRLNEKQMDLLQKQKLEDSLREYRDPAQQMKKKVVAQNSDYNKKAMKHKLQSAKSQKIMTSRIAEGLRQKQKQNIEEQTQRKEEERLAQFKYRQELIIQKHMEEAKKDQERKERLQAEINVLPLKNDDKTQMLKSYAMDLKVQMAQQAIRKQTERQKKIRQGKEMLQKSNQDFQKKFTEFATKSNRQSNPEVFQQIKSLQQARNLKKMKQRETNAKQREQTARKLKQLQDKNIKNNMKAIEQYAVELQKQIVNKKQMEHSRKMEDINYKWKEDKYTEDLVQKVKVCGECKEKFDEKNLTTFVE